MAGGLGNGRRSRPRSKVANAWKASLSSQGAERIAVTLYKLEELNSSTTLRLDVVGARRLSHALATLAEEAARP